MSNSENKITVDYDKEHQRLNEFHAEFKALVRKYVPTYPTEPEDYSVEFLADMQDRTSVYSPYIWSDEDGGK